jgi:Fe-S-cluster containining protein
MGSRDSWDEQYGRDGMSGTRESCACDSCQGACKAKPGWFLPGEAEKAAELMGMSLPEFFNAHLAVDWWEVYGDRDVFVLSPAIVGAEPGTEFPGNPRGTCVFFEAGRCRIHAAKPAECRALWHDGPPGGMHEDVATAWEDHQGQLSELLGREPESESYGFGGLFGALGL